MDNKRIFQKNLGIITGLTKDGRRTAYIALVKYSNGGYSYILSPRHGIQTNFVKSVDLRGKIVYRRRWCWHSFVALIQPKTIVHNLSLTPAGAGSAARAAGTFCVIVTHNTSSNMSKLKLPSKKIIWVSSKCTASLGRVSNINQKRHVIGSAGKNRRLGVRPTVRGVAMNPVSHPNGGKTKTNSPSKTPWGKIAKKKK